MAGPENNPRDDEPIDREEYEKAMRPGIQMPKYKCHKEVWALKIATIDLLWNGPRGALSGAEITPTDSGYAKLTVDEAYVRKHLFTIDKAIIVGGYYVVYEDGYKSFSPATAFERGYTRI